MWNKTFASRLLWEFAQSRRRVISDWRILVTARRLALADNAPLPNVKKAIELRDELIKRGDVTTIEGAVGVYIVNVPYSNLLETSEEQIVQEANPWAVFGFLTAMTYHGLTDQISTRIFAISVKNTATCGRLPHGSQPDDWSEDCPFPQARRPERLGAVEINWTHQAIDPGFGVTIGYSHGVPIYITDVERTLLDALRMPEKSGGIAKVLRAWKATESVDDTKIIKYANIYDSQVLKQRVGYLLEQLGRGDARLDVWRQNLQRGGSMRLVAHNAYAGDYSERWNLSLNVSPSILSIIEG